MITPIKKPNSARHLNTASKGNYADINAETNLKKVINEMEEDRKGKNHTDAFEFVSSLKVKYNL